MSTYRNTSLRWIVWTVILTFVTTAVPAGRMRAVADSLCFDEVDNRRYEGDDCPPRELFDGRTRTQQSDLFRHWQTLDAGTRKAYRDYVDCKNKLGELQAALNNGATDEALGAEYERAKERLKLALIGVMFKLGLQVSQITTNALADAVLFGRELRRSIYEEGGAKQQVTGDIETRGADTERKLYEAAKSREYLASLQAEVDAASARVRAAEAREAAAAGNKPAEPPPAKAPEKPGVRPDDVTEPPTRPPEVVAAANDQRFGQSNEYYSDRIFRDWPRSSTFMEVPREGWKLHVSATAESAAQVAEIVLPKLRAMKVDHKVVGSLQRYLEMGGTQRGKFITIYPESAAQAKAIVRTLDEAFAGKGLQGIAVEGEKAVGSSGLVSTRYGGYNKNTVFDPTRGIEVPDDFRGTAPPPWVPDPW